MITNLKLLGDLKFGQYKAIPCHVEMQIEVHEVDEWAEPDPNYDPNRFIDGVRATGEFFFQTSPILGIPNKHPIKSNAIGELTVRHGSDTSKLNIVITDKSSEVDIVPKKLKRYFWKFFVIGKPLWDNLEIFPKNYQCVKNMNRIFACTDFRGYWPVQVASVVVATDINEAKKILDEKLKEVGIPVEDGFCYKLTEISLRDKGAVILNDGDWK